MPLSVERIRQACDEGKYREAKELLLLALSESPHDGRLRELLGMVHYTLGDFPACVSTLEEATLMVPLSPSARICLAQAYGETGRVNLALDLLKNLSRQPENSVVHLLKIAAALDALCQPHQAMQVCRRVTREDPQHPQAFYDMAYYSARCGCSSQVTEALARKAIALAPDVVHYRVGLASLLTLQGRLDQAFEVVAHFTIKEISQVRCECCLGRILQLFVQYGKDELVALCRAQLRSLREQASSSDCC